MRKQITFDQIEKIKVVDCAETTINFYKSDIVASIWTSDSSVINKITKCDPNECKVFEGSRDSEGNITGYFIEIPKNLITIRKKQHEKRNLTKEQKAQTAQRLKNGRMKKQNKENN